jgi:hypothetical protein
MGEIDVSPSDNGIPISSARITHSMDPKPRIITQLPLTTLWRDDGLQPAEAEDH